MNPRLHIAVDTALTRLRRSDVAGATAALQRALMGHSFDRQPTEASTAEGKSGSKASLARGLETVLEKLRRERANFFDGARQGASALEDNDESENFRARSYRSAMGNLSYKLYVPAQHAERKLALVLMLHGCTQSPDDFARGTRMNALAEEFGLVVAYPLQPKSANAHACWNWFDGRHQQRGTGEPGMLAGLTRELASEFQIDGNRVFVAGMSAGGAMADVLASVYPDIFHAAGIHSGLPHGAATNLMSAFAAMKGNGASAANGTSNVRKIIFHGGTDATVHPSNGKRLFDLASQNVGRPPEYQTVMVINGKRVTRSVIGDGCDPAIAEHWLIHGGGHVWSGGDDRGSFVDATGPDASREMIRFFLGV